MKTKSLLLLCALLLAASATAAEQGGCFGCLSEAEKHNIDVSENATARAAVLRGLNGTPEAQAAFKALRTLEIKVDTGMSLAEYRQEVASMAVEIAPLDDLLHARGAADQSTKLRTIKAEYMLASQLWNACIWDIVRDHGSVCHNEEHMHNELNEIWTKAKENGQALRGEIMDGAQ